MLQHLCKYQWKILECTWFLVFLAHMNHDFFTAVIWCLKLDFDWLQVSKTLIAMAYVFVVTWITAFVMVIVHDRVPDMKRYPPLPDIFLDNVPYIPWAFHMCEWTGTLLLLIWICVLVFHKHRFVLFIAYSYHWNVILLWLI